MSEEKSDRLMFAGALAVLLSFAVLAKGAHDLWASTIVHVATMALFAVFLIRRRDGFPAGLLLPVGAALIGLSMSLLTTIKPGDTIWALKDCVVAALIFIMAADMADSDAAINTFLLIICGALVIEFALMAHDRLRAGTSMEAAGTLVNANVAAFFFLPWIPVIGERLKQSPKKRGWGILLFFAAGGLVLAASYSAILLLLVAAPFYLRRRRSWKVFLTTAAAAVVVALIVLAVREHQLASLSFYRASNRLDWWRAGLGMFFDRPLSGVGLGNFQSAYLTYKTGASQNTLYAHNIFVTLLSESGLMGVGGVTVFLTAWAAGLFKARRYETRGGFVVGFVLAAAYALYNIGPEFFVGKILLAVFAGFAAGRINEVSIRSSVLVVLLVAMVGMLPFLITPLLASQNLVYAQSVMETEPRKAQEALEAAIKLDSTLAEAHAMLAEMAFREGRLSQAMRHLEDALRLDKMNWRYLRRLNDFQENTAVNAS
jgi:hypothetical protein